MNNLLNDMPLSGAEWAKLTIDRPARLALTQESLFWFFHLYFSHYITHKTATFQKEMIDKASDTAIEHLVVMAFRGSGKSSIISTAFPIWAITGKLEKKYVLIVSQTQALANQHLKNIALELDGNELMQKDIWPYTTEQNESGNTVINLPKFNAKIIAMGREQGMRGLRHGANRPDLIIADDVEDSNSVRTMESRNSTFAWFTGELIPLGGPDTKFITVGNLLHEDSLLMRLKDSMNSGMRNGEFLEYPLLVNDTPLWPDRFPDMEAVKKLEQRVGNHVTWQREYILNLVPDDDQIISRAMIHSYSKLPDLLRDQNEDLVVGVDLAISQNTKADCTAIVRMTVRGHGDNMRMYIHPNPVNERLDVTSTMRMLHSINRFNHHPRFYVERVAYQLAVVQMMEQEGFDVKGVLPGSDKRSRLNMIAYKIQTGVILFPESGAEILIKQLVGFGIEKHDDLVDALTMAVIEYTSEDHNTGTVTFGTHDIYARSDRSNRDGMSRGASMQINSDGVWERLY